jgi:hypothetical protein
MLSIFKNVITLLLLRRIYEFLSSNENLNYVLLKKSSSFPKIKFGSDLDILTKDSKIFIKEVTKFAKKIIWVNLNHVIKSKSHTHIDIYYKKLHILKLDLIDTTHGLDHINDADNFLNNIITNQEVYTYRFFLKKYNISTPNIFDEVVIRVNELETYPHKAQHKEFINLQNDDTLLYINDTYSKFLRNPIQKYG